MCRDRRRLATLAMAVEQRAVVEVGEDVPVHHEEVLVESIDQAERADRAERLILTEVVDRHTVA